MSHSAPESQGCCGLLTCYVTMTDSTAKEILVDANLEIYGLEKL